MSIVAFDSNILSLFINPQVKPPIDPTTQQSLSRSPVHDLVTEIRERNGKVIVPTPVFAEILSTAGADIEEIVSIIQRDTIFEIKDFDKTTAIELGFLNQNVFYERDRKSSTWQKVKFDRQILTIAIVAQCDILYTNDKKLQKLAELCGLDSNGIDALPTSDSAK